MFGKRWRVHPTQTARPPRASLRVEALETRVVPYSLSGSSWPAPQLVTISFIPDGTILTGGVGGYIYSNLFATMNARYPTAMWQNEILKAAQSWAQQTNLNLAFVSDNGTTAGQGLYQQGDSGMGDIRIGGYNFVNNNLAGAYLPPPNNNQSRAGDIFLNTSEPWRIRQTGGPDLYTVLAHEVGHALGLLHSTMYPASMYPIYVGWKFSLNGDDIAGIRAIYSSGAARAKDPWDAGSGNGSFAAATNLTSAIDTGTSTYVSALGSMDVTATSDVDFYKFTAPAGSSGTLTVRVQSSGLSLLAPTLTLYNGSQQQIGFVSGSGQYGTTLTRTVSGMTPGQVVYVRVAGAEATAMGTGAYNLALNWGTGPMPPAPVPNTTLANGNPPSYGGFTPEADGHDGHPHPGGFDPFGPSPDEHSDPADPSARANERSAPETAVRAASLLGGASPLPATRSSTGFLRRVVDLARSPVTVSSDSRPAARVSATLYSGTQGEAIAGEVLGGEEREPQPVEETPALPAPAPQPFVPETPTAETQPTLALWRLACDNCFADRGWRFDAAETATPVQFAQADTEAEPAALLAGTVLMLGGYWAAQPGDPGRYKRPSIRLHRSIACRVQL
jgi:hypothetical protein